MSASGAPGTSRGLPRPRVPSASAWRALVLASWTLAGALVAARALSAQEGCSFAEGSGNLRTIDFGGSPITYVNTPNLVCRDGVRIRADSAVAYQASNYVRLLGTVRFEDAQRRLSASAAEYFTTVGRLQAHGSVRVDQKNDGGTIRGDELIYFRAGSGREVDQLDVYQGRPTARLFIRRAAADPSDATGSSLDAESRPDTALAPYEVEADRILLEGEDYFRANGRVEIERGEMQAFGDSVEFDQAGGTLRLTRRALLILNGRELSARVIRADVPEDVVREVIARGSAVLTAEDVRLEAPLMRVFFDEGVMQRLVAIPIQPVPGEPSGLLSDALAEADTTRPVARARSFVVVADSLDVITPGEVLDRIHGTGDARAESTARDSLNTAETPLLARSDWIEGDTILARFVRVDTAATSASVGADGEDAEDEYRLESLEAIGRASSLYRMPPRDSVTAANDGRPAIHYVTATRIRFEMNEGEVERMEVVGETRGVHLEPAALPGAGVTDSSVVVDSAAVDASPSPGRIGLSGAAGPGRRGSGRGAASRPEAASGPARPSVASSRRRGRRRRNGGGV